MLHMWLSDRRLALTWGLSSGCMLFIGIPPFETHNSKANIAPSLYSYPQSPVSSTCWHRSKPSICFFYIPSPIQQEPPLWMECVLLAGKCIIVNPVLVLCMCTDGDVRPFKTGKASAHSAGCELAGSIGH